jgi:S-formylglutathione hydrolase FrmB
VRCAVALLAALVVAAPAQASTLETWEVKSRFVADPAPVKVNVILPDGYAGKKRFPVLYLLHGHGGHFNDWAESGDALAITKRLGAIVVMPEGADLWYANWFNGGRRSGPAYERFFFDELVPLAEKRLRIRAGRRWHAIAGLSMGGQGSAFLASQRPGYFGALAPFSGPLSISRTEWPGAMGTQGEAFTDVFGPPQGFYATGHDPTKLVANLRSTRVFVAAGDGVPATPEDAVNVGGAAAEAYLRNHNDDFVAAARKAGVDVTYRPQQGIHSWPYWRRHLAQAIDWGLFAPVAEKPGSWTYTTVAQRSEAWGLRFSFTSPPEALETFSLAGRRLTATGAGTVRVRGTGIRSFTAKLPFTRTLSTKR